MFNEVQRVFGFSEEVDELPPDETVPTVVWESSRTGTCRKMRGVKSARGVP